MILGIGINDADYKVTKKINGKSVWCPYYQKWVSMLTRCYSKKSLEINPTYRECAVCDEWLTFSNFKAWMEKQDWEGKELDKDILKVGSKFYSPETCLFVTHKINNLVSNNRTSKGGYPLGVSYTKERNKFKAQCIGKKKVHHLGYFKTIPEAQDAYIKFKVSLIKNVADDIGDMRVKDALYKYADNLKEVSIDF